jgi:crossover junction endodeoxyribonuclease RuvC
MTTLNPHLILGLDPGYDRLGWAIINSATKTPQLVDCGCLQTNKKDTRFIRYQQIETFLEALLNHFHPAFAGIEQLYAAKNTTTVIAVAEARGIVLSALLRHQVTITEINPSTAKSAITGNGRADKAAMRKMILLQISGASAEVTQKLHDAIDDTIDAVGLALTAATVRSSV